MWYNLHNMQVPLLHLMVMVDVALEMRAQLSVQMKNKRHQLGPIFAYANLFFFFADTITVGLHRPLAFPQSVVLTAMLFNLLRIDQWTGAYLNTHMLQL